MNHLTIRKTHIRHKALRITLALIFTLPTIFMTLGKPKLADFKANIYSQFGEDGIIQKIFEIIGEKNQMCIEFGAWDGFYLSNTAALWSQKGWRALLIEGDQERFKALQKNVATVKAVTPLNAWVGTEPHNCIDTLAQQNNFLEADLLSVDIDGDDYHIIKGMAILHPRVIICEYNPTIPAELDVYQESGGHLGCSIAALERILSKKGYRLVALTDTNCFFVIDKEAVKLKALFETSLEEIRIDKYLVNAATNYRGQTLLLGRARAFPYGAHQENCPEKVFVNPPCSLPKMTITHRFYAEPSEVSQIPCLNSSEAPV